MADPLISLDTERTSAQPGGQARVSITVTNPGTVVEGYQLQVLGPLAPWAEVVPPEVSVYPQQETTAAVVISPPTGTGVPSGLQPFGVIARSTLDPNASAVADLISGVPSFSPHSAACPTAIDNNQPHSAYFMIRRACMPHPIVPESWSKRLATRAHSPAPLAEQYE